jgi:hypothetical protein
MITEGKKDHLVDLEAGGRMILKLILIRSGRNGG